MPLSSSPDVWGLIAALVISLVSGFISISARILQGTKASLLWVVSEFATAVLFGYLAYNAYPFIADSLPDWLTLPVAVAIAAHSGGRILQEVEKMFLRYSKWYLSK